MSENTSTRGGRARPPRPNHGGDKAAAGGIPTFETLKDQFDGLTLADYEDAKQKHGHDAEALVLALSSQTDGWNTVKDSKKKDADAEKSKALKGRDPAASAAGSQVRPEGISRGAPNNGAGRGVPRTPRPADAPPRESRPPRTDAPPRTREVEPRPAAASDARPRTPRQPTELPKSSAAAAAAAASAPVPIKPSTSAPVNQWKSAQQTLAQQEKSKLAAAQQREAEEQAKILSEKEVAKQQQTNVQAKQPQQREALAAPKQIAPQGGAASPKAAAPAPAPALVAQPATRNPIGGFKMNFQNSATVLPSAELQFGDMVSSENAQSGPAFQPQEQATGYTATFNAAEGQSQGNGDASSLNGNFMQSHSGGQRYNQHQQAKPPAHQQHMPHQISPYGGFWNPQMMYMGNPNMYGHMGMPMMPFAYPQGYPQQGMYGQQAHNSGYRHGKNQGHNSQSAHGTAQHPGGVAPAHHYQQQQTAYPASFPAADGQEGTLDSTQQQQQQHKDAPQQPYYNPAYSQPWQGGKAAGKPSAGMVGHHTDYSYGAQPYWSAAQNFVPQQQQQQQHTSSTSAPTWTGH